MKLYVHILNHLYVLEKIWEITFHGKKLLKACDPQVQFHSQTQGQQA